MTSVLSIYKDTGGSNGSPATSTNIGPLGPPSLRLKTSDDTTVDNSNPIPIPTSGTNYSYWSSLYVYCLTAPNTLVNNFQFYTDGNAYGTGITTYIGNQFPTHYQYNSAQVSTGYVVATGTQGTTGTEMISGYSGVTSKTNIFTYISSNPLSGPTINNAQNGGLIQNVGDTTNYFIVQAAVGTSAGPGTKTQSTWYVFWDEI